MFLKEKYVEGVSGYLSFYLRKGGGCQVTFYRAATDGQAAKSRLGH